ncbi:MAG: DegT/DnrJ/EryC1/StrS family aminotransferase [Chloroflexi bacterium]|nr:DegT/DnrJ/EryC1/StrS family aminotransferase [Chloroflexota bacterium]
MNIGIAKPFIGQEEKQAVLDVLESGQLVQGAKVEAFEKAFAEYHGAAHGIATTNGTTALMASMMAHDIEPGDEIIIPAFSFFATASCILSVKAKPVFADIDPDTFCLSPEAAEAAITPNTVAIMPVHLYGHPADMHRFEEICENHGLLLLEDAAQAHGAAINGRKVGTWVTASFSFYPSKNMTTGEGGMALTNNDEIASKLRMIRNQGMNQQYKHEVVGYNFRMTNLMGAIGLAQLNRLDDWNDKRIVNAEHFDAHLTSVKTPTRRDGVTHVYHQYTVRVPDSVDRDRVVQHLNSKGIGARVYYPKPIHQQPIFQELGYVDAELPATDVATQQVFSLPVHPALTEEEKNYIVNEVNNIC